jgi:type VI secretion system protein ImpL
MTAVVAFLLSRWTVTFVGTALLALLLWFFGPFLGFLESVLVRAAIIVAMFVLWAAINLLLSRRRRRREAELTEGVAASTDPASTAAAEEVAALQDRLRTALALLRRARGSKGYLYEQPWYVIIGPPGAGKTTALLNAGLRFPLATELGQNAVTGIGGTRLCDWWFTDEAVLIDTAGRYTTQDSDTAVDRAGWEGFLDLLKRTRLRQPLNGVLVAIALTDIGWTSRDERLAHARAIRRRIRELQERLNIRLPIYAVFTKSDLISGFTEFFDDLDRDRRGQVWGATCALTEADTGPVGAFPGEFTALVQRLNERLIDRLQAERSPDRRVLIAGFPAQMASLEPALQEFLQEAFGGSRLDPAPMLRGFYFTSGTQQGTPLDRLTDVLARSFGIDQRQAASLRPEQGRSYFLARLIKDVVFGEAMLVSERPGMAKRRLLLRGGALAAVGLVTLIAIALLSHERNASRQEIDDMAAALAAYEKTASALPLDPVADADLPRMLPLLDQARALPHGYDESEPGISRWLQLGLSQDAKLAAGARTIYRHALERVLLPRLLWRLETQMGGKLNQPEFLYEATRVYLMLGSAGPLDRSLLRTWMKLDWQAEYSGPAMAPVREALARHLDALLKNPLPTIGLDDQLVAVARTTFSRVPLANRVYSRIGPSPAAQAVPVWRPADALGAAGVRVFVRASGKPLTDGIPGFYTVAGFYTVLLPALGNVTKEVASESWVLGTRAELAPDSTESRRVEHDVIALYDADYAAQWDRMLGELELVPLRNAQQAAQNLYVLGSPQSPIRDLLQSVSRQLNLTKPPEMSAAEKAAAAAAPKTAAPAEAQLKGLLFSSGTAAAADPPGKAIDDRYRALRTYVGNGPGAPLDQTLKAIDALRQQLSKMGLPPVPTSPAAAPTGDDPVSLLRAEAAAAPQPVARWLTAMADGATVLRTGSTVDEVKKAFSASGGPATLCRQAVTGRYPFTPGSANDIPLDDFTKLFAPGGLIDGFFNTQLRTYVDTSGTVWQPHPIDGVPAPVSAADLAQFQRAAVIRDMFFPAGATPSLRFDLTPVSLDSATKDITLDLGGTTITYANGPPRATQVTWPGANGMGSVRLVFDPVPAVTTASGGATATPASTTPTAPSTAGGALQASGPWALFRLFDQGRLAHAGSVDHFTLTFHVGEHQAAFEVRAGSVVNPFASSVLRDFRCPNL